MKMFMHSCLRLAGTIIMIQISTQPYVFGRPSPPASYDLVTTTPLPEETESFQTGLIPGLTPEESFDVVEKILQGELQPVIKTAEFSFEPPDLHEVPSLTGSKNNGFVKAPGLVDESVSYFEPPQFTDKPDVMNMDPEREFPLVESSHESSPTSHQSTDGKVWASSKGYPLTDPLEEEEKPAPSLISVYQPTDGVPIHAHDFLLDSFQNVPEVGETGLVNNNLAHPISKFPTDKLEEDKMLLSKPTTLQRRNGNSFVSHPLSTNSVQVIQDFPNILNASVSVESVNLGSVLPKASTEKSEEALKTITQTTPMRSSVDSVLSEEHGQSVLVSGVAPGKSSQEVRQPTKPLDFPVSQDLSDQSIQVLRDLPESVNTGIEDHPFNNPDGTLRTVRAEEPVSAQQTTPVKSVNSFNVKKYGEDSPVKRGFPEKSVEAVSVLPNSDSTNIVEDTEANNDLVLDKVITDLLPDHPSGDEKDAAVFERTDIDKDTKNSAGPVSSAMRRDGLVLEEGAKDLLGFPSMQQIKQNNVPSAFPWLKVKSTQDVRDTPGLTYPVFQNVKPPSLLDPRKSFDLMSKPSMSVAKTLLRKRNEGPTKESSRLAENLTFPMNEPPGIRALSDTGIKDILLEKPTDVDRVAISKKDSNNFRNFDMDLLALSDILDSRQDSKSDELLWSAEDSEEDAEFWRKMKRFIAFENARSDERDEIKIDTTSPVNLSENIIAIPIVETKPTEAPVVHVMKILNSRSNNAKQGEEDEDKYCEGLKMVEDKNFQNSDNFPVQEESSTVLPTTEGLESTEVTTPEAGLSSNGRFYGTGLDIEEYNSNDFVTTDESPSYSIPPTERPEYEYEPIFLEPDTGAAKSDINSQTAKADESFEVTATPENEFDKSTDSMSSKIFRKDQPKRTPCHNILPSRRELFPGNVGRPDNVPELRDDTVLPQDDPRFSEGITENFTTDEPLIEDDMAYVEYSIKSPSPVSKQEKELLSKPTDLELLEADSPVPALSNCNHFVSKKDNPMKTVKYVRDDELKDKQKTKIPPEHPYLPKTYVYPLSLEAISRKRVRRSDDQTKSRVEENGLNDTDSSTQSVSGTSSRPTSSIVLNTTPSTPLSVSPTSPSPVSTSKSAENLLSAAGVQFSATTTVTSNPAASTGTPAPSIPLTPLTLFTTTMTPASSTALALSTTSTSLKPPTTFEMLPTPIPDTSTTANPLAPTLTPTNKPTPKKKKKMVWKIPFYPNNIAISSSGEVRLEPKDKSALVQTTTPKPVFLRDRLKPEDLQAARERLFRRFQLKRPTVVPVLDAARPDILKTNLPLMPPPIMTQRSTGGLSVRPKVNEDVLAYVTAENPSQLPSLLYNTPEEREEARRRRLRNVVGLAGDVRSFLSDRARGAVRTVGNLVGGETQKKDNV